MLFEAVDSIFPLRSLRYTVQGQEKDICNPFPMPAIPVISYIISTSAILSGGQQNYGSLIREQKDQLPGNGPRHIDGSDFQTKRTGGGNECQVLNIAHRSLSEAEAAMRDRACVVGKVRTQRAEINGRTVTRDNLVRRYTP